MAVNWPNWVTDDSSVPAVIRVPCKKAIWLYVACEKLRMLHNGVWKWARGASTTEPDPVTGEVISEAEDSVLAEEFAEGNWPLEYPADTPTPAQAASWLDTYWRPRQTEVQEARGNLRRDVPIGWFAYVDLRNILV